MNYEIVLTDSIKVAVRRFKLIHLLLIYSKSEKEDVDIKEIELLLKQAGLW